jgi:transcription elongation factor GreA
MSQKKYLFTQEGMDKLKAELDVLINEKRKEVIERIQEAVAHGDLSENADYAQAKEEQSFTEGRIQEIEEMLKNVEIIETGGHKHSNVTIGSKVVISVTDHGTSSERSYTIVGSNEANPSQGKISNESMVGKALIGRKTSESFKVETPAGEMTYKVISIE